MLDKLFKNPILFSGHNELVVEPRIWKIRQTQSCSGFPWTSATYFFYQQYLGFVCKLSWFAKYFSSWTLNITKNKGVFLTIISTVLVMFNKNTEKGPFIAFHRWLETLVARPPLLSWCVRCQSSWCPGFWRPGFQLEVAFWWNPHVDIPIY